MREVVIVSTGAANIASVRAWLERAGVDARETTAASEVASAGAIVLPGVGAFGPAMMRLRELELVAPLRERVLGGRPTLCICLGMQLLFEASEEAPGVGGIGVVEGVVRRLPASVRTPQMGWNHVDAHGDGAAALSGFAYFAHSYGVTRAPAGWDGAFTTVGDAQGGVRVVASWSRGAVAACQFHPELSSAYGVALLSRWLDFAMEGSSCRRTV
jgi:imidazole glycerol phosphate synthase glutamine amidotransferase subunit